MVGDPALIKSYSEALFQTALNKGCLEEVADKADALLRTLEATPRLIVFLNTPSIGFKDKEDLILKVFHGRIHQLLENFLLLLVRRTRLDILSEVLEVFHDRYNEHRGVAPAIVTTAIALNDAMKQKVEGSFSSFMGKKLVIRWKVDPSLEGGIRFLCGDTLIDRTIERGLDELRQTLLSARVY
jgi:F-type H+-transporting ATPase subunit delta